MSKFKRNVKQLMQTHTIIITLMCLCFISLGACKDSADKPMKLDKSTNSVIVPNGLKQCEIDMDCVLVDVDCNDCCSITSIHVENQQNFFEKKKMTCEIKNVKRGQVCDCTSNIKGAVCRRGVCRGTIN